MSVQQLNPEIFNKVYSKMNACKDNKIVNINYIETLRRKDFSEEDIKKLVQDWCYLNQLSYIYKYNDGLPEWNLWNYEFIGFTEKYRDISMYQFLKYLHSIRYNIEMQYVPSWMSIQKSYTLSYDIMRDVEMRVIAEIPEYKQAK